MKKLILVIIALILTIFLVLLFIVNNNKSYKANLIKDINNHYSKKVNYVNKYGNNFIVKTSDKVVALNEEYKEITSEKLNNIKKLDYDLVYKKNAIMYQKSQVKDKNIIYTYYDIKTGKEIDKLEIEG